MGLGETPRRFNLYRCRYSSLQKVEDAFDTTRLNASKAVGCGIFGCFSNLDKCRPEAAGDVIFRHPCEADKPVKFHDPGLNRSREIRPEAVEGCIFDIVFATTTYRKQIMTSYGYGCRQFRYGYTCKIW